ncbi:AMP-binding protein [Acinetobacter sp.]|uniref:AMP-binding protein n=1 Tax=Acinetobacter sp. TaxID=472 RepID=UPI0031D194BD
MERSKSIIPDESLKNVVDLITGPWYSWLPPKYELDQLSDQAVLQIICRALEVILIAIEKSGPFDAIYGFSQGAYIVNLVNNLQHDPILLAALKKHMGSKWKQEFASMSLFNTAVYACAGGAYPLNDIRRLAGLPENTEKTHTNNNIHLMGKFDGLKPWSELIAVQAINPKTQIYYLDSEHEITSDVPVTVKEAIKNTINGNSREDCSLEATIKPSCSLSSIKIDSDYQVANVSIRTQALAKTISELLERRSPEAPLFRNAREQNSEICTTYGDMLKFISSGGEGDLRRIGVVTGQIVAYLAPSGGTAESAAAFLTVASQACAVPLSSSLTESETLEALQQLKVDHIIIFDGVIAKNVINACEKYRNNNDKKLHHVKPLSKNKPGLFMFEESLSDYSTFLKPISNANDNILLLRTSGTTSTPKVVPLKQMDLVINGAILADSIGINEFDVTYSVMPLDHIGGISASILASLSVGAAITCDGTYNPQLMAEALVNSNPKPTWYSAVPTIQLSTLRYVHANKEKYLNDDGTWSEHNLRLIRSGAAALNEDDRQALIKTYDCPVLPTYSMSELMPISQPAQNEISWDIKPSSVGVPLVASMAIVDPQTLSPLPYGEAGEVAISGQTVFSGYKDNPEANSKSRFVMPIPNTSDIRTWFLTGDLGQLDASGNLSLEGRLKELIKRGGEQIAPVEIEGHLACHSSVDIAICFPVPSELYGEEVGCAIVSSDPEFSMEKQAQWVKELRKFLHTRGVSPHKIPTVWRVVDKNDLPMTSSKKYKRNVMADVFGITDLASNNNEKNSGTGVKSEKQKEVSNSTSVAKVNHKDKPDVDWDTIAGFRFILACYVMFMHIGANNSWEAFNNLRQFQWHVNSFFILAGFSLAVLMPSYISKKFAFVKSRVVVMYPLYFLAMVFAMTNLFVSCNLSTFIPTFSWGPFTHEAGKSFCQGTPWIEGSWFWNVISSFVIHVTGLQATPLWGASWFIGFYLWFISMYFQCLVVFPIIYNAMYKHRGNVNKILTYIGVGLVVNAVILFGFWFGFWFGFAVDFVGFGHFDPITGLRTIIPTVSQIALAGKDNAIGLGFYLFAPFWMIYFLVGIGAAFLYDAIRPTEQKYSYIWGYVADAITLIILCVSIAHIAQGYTHFDPTMNQVPVDAYFMRPEAANSYADPSITNRIWDEIYSRSFAPLTVLWIFALSTGKGVTARILKSSPLSQVLAPTAYACFLFHQMVGQWYYAATRGDWWNWWENRKSFYWFSPEPVPVEWYEYFYVVGLVVLFAKLIQPADIYLRNGTACIVNFVKNIGNNKDHVNQQHVDTADVVLKIASRISGFDADKTLSLNDNGLASLGIVQFVSALESEFSTLGNKVSISMQEIMETNDLNEVIAIIDKALLKTKPLQKTQMTLDTQYQ